MQITVTIDGEEVSTAPHAASIEDVEASIAAAEPAPERFQGIDGAVPAAPEADEMESEIDRNAVPAPARFRPPSR